MPEIKQFPTLRVACVTQTGSFDQAIPNGMNQLAGWAQANNIQPQGQPFAMFLDDPAEVPVEQLHTLVCLPVGPEAEGSDGVQIQEIGGFDVATLVYQNREDMGRYYNDLYGWLQEQGYRDAGAPMETYMNLDDFTAEIAIPIERIQVIMETDEEPTWEPSEEVAEPEPIKPQPDPWKRAPAKKAATKKRVTKKTAGKKTAKKAAKKAAKKSTKKTTKKTAAKKRAKK